MSTATNLQPQDFNTDEQINDEEYKNLVPWFTPSGDTDENGRIRYVKNIKVNLFKFSKFLMSLGFYRFEKDREYFTVRVKNQIVQVCTPTDVIDAVEDYIKNLEGGYVHSPRGKITKDILLAKLFSGISTYFSDNI